MNQPDTFVEFKLLDIPPTKVRSSKYETPILTLTKGVAAIDLFPIQKLNEILIPKSGIMLSLRFPFEQPFGCVIHGDDINGITKKNIIDGIRKAYRQMYRHSRDLPSKQISNNTSIELIAYPLKNLIIESVIYYPEKDTIKARIEGLEKVITGQNFPF
jgi:hypothetical protein